MKKYLIAGVLIALLIAVVSGVATAKDFTDEEVAALIAQAPGPQAYPQASALVLLSQKHIKANEDGSSVIDEYLIAKILQDRGKYKYADIKRRFDKESEICQTGIAPDTPSPQHAVSRGTGARGEVQMRHDGRFQDIS